MRSVWAVTDSILSPLGLGTDKNYDRIRAGESAVRDFSFNGAGEQIKAAAFDQAPGVEGLTRFESLVALTIENVLEGISLDKSKTLFILSTTKGNIDLITEEPKHSARLRLSATAKRIADRFGLPHVRVVSNACVSGLLAIIAAKRAISSGQYDHAIVVGADIISPFVVSGFMSLQALSPEVCRPFDSERNGINLGEACAAMILSGNPTEIKGRYKVLLCGEGTSSDANHISGPSRTGEELAAAITQAIGRSGSKKSDIDFVSAHGTATVFNDEMEARAFFLAGLEGVPINSLKCYFGHTLGAAGILESVISVRSLVKSEVIGTLGFKTRGVSMPVKIATKTQSLPMKRLLKTASGFGGCNAAVVFENNN